MNATYSIAVVALCLLGGGCYQQQPLQSSQPTPATRVVAELTDSGIVAMGNAIGSGATEVEGVVTAADERTWTLQMLRVAHRDGRSIDWNREIVTFPAATLRNPMVVVLDKRRSVLAVGGITLGAILIARAFNIFGADDGKDGIPIPQE